MAQMTPEVSKLLEQALSLSVEEQGRWRIPRFSTSVARWVREYKRPGKPRSGSNRRTGIRRGTNHFLGGSASAHLGEAASCPPVFRSFMMKPPPNMMRHSTGTWRAAPMRTQVRRRSGSGARRDHASSPALGGCPVLASQVLAQTISLLLRFTGNRRQRTFRSWRLLTPAGTQDTGSGDGSHAPILGTLLTPHLTPIVLLVLGLAAFGP